MALSGFCALSNINFAKNNLDGVGLIHLAPSAGVLDILNLSCNRIIDSHLSFLKDANFLEGVILNDNELDCSCLNFLVKSAPRLHKLMLLKNLLVAENMGALSLLTEIKTIDIVLSDCEVNSWE